MATIRELKGHIDLKEVYNNSLTANQYTKKGATKLGFLVLLKTFQRLGYFVDSNIVPSAIVSHIIKCTQLSVLPSCLTSYEQSKTRKRHIALIREFQSVTSYFEAWLLALFLNDNLN
jgi:Domain of unknown function (DUF4158)